MWRLGAFMLLFASLALGIACGDSDAASDSATSTPQPNATGVPRTYNQRGEPLNFRRTADAFAPGAVEIRGQVGKLGVE